MTSAFRLVPIDWVKPDPNQPRRTFDEGAIAGMAESMRSSGVIEPVLVCADGTLLNGERRWRAAKMAGLTEIPAIVKEDLDDLAAMEIQAVEATQDEEVPTLERYEFWHRLYLKEKERNAKFSIVDLGRILGVKERTIAGAFKAIGAPEELKEMVREGQIGASLLPIIDGEGLGDLERIQIARKITSGVFRTTGTTLQSELMPLVRKAPESVRHKLVNEPDYSLEDAKREVGHLERVEAARRAMESGEEYREPPMSLGEFGLKLESKVATLSRVLDDVARNAVAANLPDWMWNDLLGAIDRLIAALEAVKASRGTRQPPRRDSFTSGARLVGTWRSCAGSLNPPGARPTSSASRGVSGQALFDRPIVVIRNSRVDRTCCGPYRLRHRYPHLVCVGPPCAASL